MAAFEGANRRFAWAEFPLVEPIERYRGAESLRAEVLQAVYCIAALASITVRSAVMSK